MKLKQFSLVGVGVLLISVPAIPEIVSTYANSAPVTTLSSGGTPSSSGTLTAATEWLGPFASWANVKTTYGAKGDGSTDDTAAFQRAFNEIGTSGKSYALYIPAGTYRITSTLTMTTRAHISVIGEHPDSTSLRWDGSQNGVMIWLNGVAYGKFNRLTFDGNGGRASVLIDQSKQGNVEYFDTANEYVDDVFKDAGIGIRGGNLGFGSAESSVLRCKFYRMSTAGIILKNFNALDWFIWHCTFEDNRVGVGNEPGAGAFHIFGSVFRRSTSADIYIRNTGLFSFRDNTSVGSSRFFLSENPGMNGAITTFQRNTIIDSLNNDTVVVRNTGPVVMMDNVFASRTGATGPIVRYESSGGPNLLSVGNTFTASNPIRATAGSETAKLVMLDDNVVSRNTLNPSVPTLPGVPPRTNRQIFEVPAGASAATIQQVINQAAQLCGQRPVVHLPTGNYNISQTVVVPANCDIQLVGDEGSTRLNWSGSSGTTPVLRLAGPSRAILQDFFVMSYGKSAGIVVENADQSGARIYMQQANVVRGLSACILVDSLDRANVELHNIYINYTHYISPGTGAGVKVVGGPAAANGNNLGGKTSVFAAGTSNNYLTFDVTNGGRLIVRDVWYEGDGAATFARVAGRSVFTVEGSRMALPRNGASIKVEGLTGRATVMTIEPQAPVVLDGSGNGSVWVVGSASQSQTSNYFVNNSSNTRGVFTNNRWFNGGSFAVADQGTADANFIRDMLAHTRSEKPTENFSALGSGITDLRISRVYVDSGSVGIHIKAQ